MDARTSTPKVLEVVLDGAHAGRLTQDRHGRLTFAYEEGYRSQADATPLSLSMRLTRLEHGNKVVEPFLRGLLPDSQPVLERWGARFGVSANSPFGLLTHVGEDIAGAAQFVRPDRLAEITNGGSLSAVDAEYIAERLAVLRADRAAWSDLNSPGQFSLAGAQSKFALYRDPNTTGWSIPSGRYATTHIFKPALPHLNDQDINEHLCLVAADNLGLDAAPSRIMHFGDERAIVLTRYDRDVDADGEVTRIHQEDFCQALAVMPVNKYERGDNGAPGHGPGVVDMIKLMREVQSVDDARDSAEHYIKALAYNWLIYGPDAHAKNYSILLAAADAIPSPLYDISSVLPYPRTGSSSDGGFDLRHMAMAMSVDGQYQNSLVTGAQWAGLAAKLKLDADEVLGWVDEIAERVPDAFVDAATADREAIGDSRVITALVDGVASYSSALRRNLGMA
jgi:serine/threonine-protein kinase HipA